MASSFWAHLAFLPLLTLWFRVIAGFLLFCSQTSCWANSSNLFAYTTKYLEKSFQCSDLGILVLTDSPDWVGFSFVIIWDGHLIGNLAMRGQSESLLFWRPYTQSAFCCNHKSVFLWGANLQELQCTCFRTSESDRWRLWCTFWEEVLALSPGICTWEDNADTLL